MAAAPIRTLFDLQTAAKLAITAGFVLPLMSAPATRVEPSVLRLRDMLRAGHVDAARALVEWMIEASYFPAQSHPAFHPFLPSI